LQQQHESRLSQNRGLGSKTIEDIAPLAGAFMQGMKKAGMANTGKHFPGHGLIALRSKTGAKLKSIPTARTSVAMSQPHCSASSALTDHMRQIRPDILIAVDQEGGRVQRLRSGFTLLQSTYLLWRFNISCK
jgi:beta-glucosidase-like glycosyl hydrolase